MGHYTRGGGDAGGAGHGAATASALHKGSRANRRASTGHGEGVARVARRAMSRVSSGNSGITSPSLCRYLPRLQQSVVTLRSRPWKQTSICVSSMARRKETVTIGSNRGPKAAKIGILSDPAASTLEKALLAGGVHETRTLCRQLDLVGIEKQILSAIFDASTPNPRSGGVHRPPDAPAGVNAVLRVVFPSAAVPSSVTTAQASHTGIASGAGSAGGGGAAVGGDERARRPGRGALSS